MLWRRFPNLLYRRFPNRPAGRIPDAPPDQTPPGLIPPSRTRYSRLGSLRYEFAGPDACPGHASWQNLWIRARRKTCRRFPKLPLAGNCPQLPYAPGRTRLPTKSAHRNAGAPVCDRLKPSLRRAGSVSSHRLDDCHVPSRLQAGAPKLRGADFVGSPAAWPNSLNKTCFFPKTLA